MIIRQTGIRKEAKHHVQSSGCIAGHWEGLGPPHHGTKSTHVYTLVLKHKAPAECWCRRQTWNCMRKKNKALQ
eukprot:1161000-Pelagomonas_calceolata.AAC.14